MRRSLPILLLAVAACKPATAAAPDQTAPQQTSPQQTAPQQTAIRAVIASQIDALRHGDGARAFSFASPGIEARFGDPAHFMAMVREGYAPLTRPGSLHFGTLEDGQGGPVQHVDIVDDTGAITEAEYFMEREPDGSWRVSGCALLTPKQAGA